MPDIPQLIYTFRLLLDYTSVSSLCCLLEKSYRPIIIIFSSFLPAYLLEALVRGLHASFSIQAEERYHSLLVSSHYLIPRPGMPELDPLNINIVSDKRRRYFCIRMVHTSEKYGTNSLIDRTAFVRLEKANNVICQRVFKQIA